MKEEYNWSALTESALKRTEKNKLGFMETHVNTELHETIKSQAFVIGLN